MHSYFFTTIYTLAAVLYQVEASGGSNRQNAVPLCFSKSVVQEAAGLDPESVAGRKAPAGVRGLRTGENRVVLGVI